MLLRLLRYPFSNAKARGMAAGLIPPGEVVGRARSTLTPADRSGREPELLLQPERRLVLDYLAFGQRLARSLPGASRLVLERFLDRPTVENLKAACRGLITGSPRDLWEERLLPVHQLRIFPESARRAGTLEELAGILPRSPWREALRAALEGPEQERLPRLESRLDQLFWQEVEQPMRRLSLFDRAAALEVLGPRADLDRYRAIRRGGESGRSAAEVLAWLPGLEKEGLKEVAEALLAGNSESSPSRRFRRGQRHLLPSEGEGELMERLYRRCRQVLRQHPFDLSAPLAAVLLKELELRDLRSALGGLRLGLADGEIGEAVSRKGG